jgi:uncharacterized RDD family membrane protein YckC
MSNIQINTTQNVNINMRLASIGERLLAALIDLIIIIAFIYVMGRIIDAFDIIRYDMDQWSKIAIYSLLFLPAMIYTMVSEIFFKGQTLGKKILKIKVIKKDGYAANFGDYFTRWMFRLVDIWLLGLTPIIGIVSIIVSKDNQRIGDMASGTAVISLKERYKINHKILEETQSSQYKPTYPSVIQLSDNDIRIIRSTFYTATKSKDNKTIEKLSNKIQEITKTEKNDLTDIEYIKLIIKDYIYFTQNM